MLVRWRVAYNEEAMGIEPSPQAEAQARDIVEEKMLRQGDRNGWVLEDAQGRLVSMTTMNASIPAIVQIGGVYTPPEHRGRGYGRAVVAGQLQEARAQGVERAILFTDQENRPARKTYEALGFRPIGHYGLVLFEEPVALL